MDSDATQKIRIEFHAASRKAVSSRHSSFLARRHLGEFIHPPQGGAPPDLALRREGHALRDRARAQGEALRLFDRAGP
jgi:hypothetical protein